jgi:hypothetical protein
MIPPRLAIAVSRPRRSCSRMIFYGPGRTARHDDPDEHFVIHLKVAHVDSDELRALERREDHELDQPSYATPASTIRPAPEIPTALSTKSMSPGRPSLEGIVRQAGMLGEPKHGLELIDHPIPPPPNRAQSRLQTCLATAVRDISRHLPLP